MLCSFFSIICLNAWGSRSTAQNEKLIWYADNDVVEVMYSRTFFFIPQFPRWHRKKLKSQKRSRWLVASALTYVLASLVCRMWANQLSSMCWQRVLRRLRTSLSAPSIPMRISIFFSRFRPWSHAQLNASNGIYFDRHYFLFFLCQVRRVPIPDSRFDYLVEYHKPVRWDVHLALN